MGGVGASTGAGASLRGGAALEGGNFGMGPSLEKKAWFSLYYLD